jgi:hypothetical protein
MNISVRTESSFGFMFRCQKRNHDIRQSISVNTWFEDAKISVGSASF